MIRRWSIANNAFEIKRLRSPHRAPSGKAPREANPTLRERAGTTRLSCMFLYCQYIKHRLHNSHHFYNHNERMPIWRMTKKLQGRTRAPAGAHPLQERPVRQPRPLPRQKEAAAASRRLVPHRRSFPSAAEKSRYLTDSLIWPIVPSEGTS